jgi:hypothetical protein
MNRALVALFALCSFVLMASPAHVRAQAGAATVSAQAAAPTWNKDVAQIIYNNCVTCHRPGEVAPMSLMSYPEARPWAKGIKAMVESHQMPPWFADTRYGHFNNKRGLTSEEIEKLVAWANAGAPQGAGAVPAVPDFGDRNVEIMDRPPDFVFGMPVAIDIPASGGVPNFYVWEKVPFAQDKYISAVENRPSNRAVTHHSSFRTQPLPEGAHHIGLGHAWPGGPMINAVPVREDGTELTDSTDFAVDEPTQANSGDKTLGNILTFYTPGTGSLRFRPGYAKEIKHDQYFAWFLHYNPTGRPETDRHQVSLWFSQDPTVHIIQSGNASDVEIYDGVEAIGRGVKRDNIPAGEANYHVASLRPIKSDTTLNSLWPHMHLRGHDQTWSVTYPDGREEVLLSVPNYSFEWQIQYIFDTPVKLPAGSMLRVSTHYDNSAKNKFNPAPDQDLPWGEQSWHEMYFPHFNISIDKDVVQTGQGTGTEQSKAPAGTSIVQR